MISFIAAFTWCLNIHQKYKLIKGFKYFTGLNAFLSIELFAPPSFFIAISFFHIVTQFPFTLPPPYSYIIQNLAEMSFAIYLCGYGYTLYWAFGLWDVYHYLNTVYPYVKIILIGALKIYTSCAIVEFTRKKLFNLFLYKRKYYYIFRFIDHDFYKKSIPSSII